jgi:hypothetical protein
MWLPRSLAATALGGLNYAKMKLQVLDNGAFHTKDFSIPASVVAMLRVDMTQKSYKDMQNQIQMKVMLMSRVLYLSDEDMSSIRVLVQQSVDNDDLGFALESVFLEVMCANARDVHGGWMHIFLLSIDNKEAKGSLRSSLRAQTSAPISMACTVHTCGACAHSAAGHDTDAELRQLENTCYAAKQCGVERCAGTLVNMRKPLCNLGKVLTSERP